MYPGSQSVMVNKDKTSKRFAGEITASSPVTSDARTFPIRKPDACAHTKQVKVTRSTLDISSTLHLGKRSPELCCVRKPRHFDLKDPLSDEVII